MIGAPVGGAARPVRGAPRLQARQLDAAELRREFLARWRAVIAEIVDRGTYLDRDGDRWIGRRGAPRRRRDLRAARARRRHRRTRRRPAGANRRRHRADRTHASPARAAGHVSRAARRARVDAGQASLRRARADAPIQARRGGRVPRRDAIARRRVEARALRPRVAGGRRRRAGRAGRRARDGALRRRAARARRRRRRARGECRAEAGRRSAYGIPLDRRVDSAMDRPASRGAPARDRRGLGGHRRVDDHAGATAAASSEGGRASGHGRHAASSSTASCGRSRSSAERAASGRRTVSCALAIAAADAGDEPVLLVSTDPAPSIADALGDPDQAAWSVERRVSGVPRLTVRQIDATAAFAAARDRYQTQIDAMFGAVVARGVDVAHDRAMVRDLLALAPPGVDELFALSVLGDALAAGRFARIVVDPAPTGHLLRLLEMPAIALDWTHRLMRLMLKYRDVVGLGDAAAELLDFAKRTRALDALAARSRARGRDARHARRAGRARGDAPARPRGARSAACDVIALRVESKQARDRPSSCSSWPRAKFAPQRRARRRSASRRCEDGRAPGARCVLRLECSRMASTTPVWYVYGIVPGDRPRVGARRAGRRARRARAVRRRRGVGVGGGRRARTRRRRSSGARRRRVDEPARRRARPRADLGERPRRGAVVPLPMFSLFSGAGRRAATCCASDRRSSPRRSSESRGDASTRCASIASTPS